MEKIKKEIEVFAYINNEGKPTCAMDFETGEICIFYRTYKLGCVETCVFASYCIPLERSKNGEGTLIPGTFCPIWKGEL